MKKIKIECDVCKNNLYLINSKDYVKINIKNGVIPKKDKVVYTIASSSMPKPFYCKQCNFFKPFYSTMGNSLIKVEKIKSKEVT